MTFSISFLLQSAIPIDTMNSIEVTPPLCPRAIQDNLLSLFLELDTNHTVKHYFGARESSSRPVQIDS